MFASHFQGGPAVEVFTTKGKNPLEKWKVFGGSKNVSRVYDKSSKGYIYEVGGTQTKIQLPADDRKHTLRLQQPYLLFQVRVPLGKSFGVELGFHDAFGTRRRILLSTAFKETRQTPLHTRVPLPVTVRNGWLNICLDLPDLVATNFQGQAFNSLDFISISAWCSLRKIFTLKNPPQDSLNPTSEAQPIPEGLDVEGSCVQLVRMSTLSAPAFQSAPTAARPHTAAHNKTTTLKPSLTRPSSAPTNCVQKAPIGGRPKQLSQQTVKTGPLHQKRNSSQRAQAGEVQGQVRGKAQIETIAHVQCDDAGDMCSPQSNFDVAVSHTDDQFAMLSLQERRRHLDAVCTSLDESEDPDWLPMRSARQVWASSPTGAAEQLAWNPSAAAEHMSPDYSSRYEDEDVEADNRCEAMQAPNPWTIDGTVHTSPTHSVASAVWSPLQERLQELLPVGAAEPLEHTSLPVQARESVLLADAMQIYGEESRYMEAAISSPSPSQLHARSSNEADGDESPDEDLWLSHSPRELILGHDQPSSTAAPDWLVRPPAVLTSMDNSASPLGFTLFQPTDSPSPSSLSQNDFGATGTHPLHVEPRNEYEPSAYSDEKPASTDAGWSSPDVYNTCLVASDHMDSDCAQEDDEDELDLLYDPASNCYYDPRTNQYYELKD